MYFDPFTDHDDGIITNPYLSEGRVDGGLGMTVKVSLIVFSVLVPPVQRL